MNPRAKEGKREQAAAAEERMSPRRAAELHALSERGCPERATPEAQTNRANVSRKPVLLISRGTAFWTPGDYIPVDGHPDVVLIAGCYQYGTAVPKGSCVSMTYCSESLINRPVEAVE